MTLAFDTYDLDAIIKYVKERRASSSFYAEVYDFLSHWSQDAAKIEILSSGSTGPRKKMLFTKDQLLASAKITNTLLKLDSKSTALLALPLSFVAGKMMLVRALQGRYKLIIKEAQANPLENIDTLIDFAAFTPYQLEHILHDDANALDNIAKVLVGGSPMTATLEARLKDRKGSFYESYGMSETLTHVAIRKIGVDEDFKILPTFEMGTDNENKLKIRAEHLGGHWIQTNDVVAKTSDRSFKWLGRADFVINSGGVKLFPEQIEAKLRPLIHSSFAIGSKKDKKLGQKVVLYLSAGASITRDEMKRVLSSYELPKEIIRLDKLPMNTNNKLSRRDLNE